MAEKPHLASLFRDLIRALVALAVITATTILGIRNVLDASAITGIFGAAIGVVGATGAIAVANGRTNGRGRNDDVQA